MSKDVCKRCQKSFKNLPTKIQEVVFFLRFDDNIPPKPPLVADLSNQELRLCSNCIRAGGVTELVKELKTRMQLDEKDVLTYDIHWVRRI